MRQLGLTRRVPASVQVRVTEATGVTDARVQELCRWDMTHVQGGRDISRLSRGRVRRRRREVGSRVVVVGQLVRVAVLRVVDGGAVTIDGVGIHGSGSHNRRV